MITIGSLTVTCNQTTRAWEVQGGQPVTPFPSGPTGQRMAIKHAIQEAYPQVTQAVNGLIDKHPQLAGRAWDAARLLIAGHVLVPGVDAEHFHIARVVSQADKLLPRHYYVGILNGAPTCTCQDYEYGGAQVGDHVLCKHVLAYCLGQHLAWPLREGLSGPSRPRKVAGGVWRSRVATRVNGRTQASRSIPNKSSHNRRKNGVDGEENDTLVYANGEPVEAAHRAAYAAFTDVMRTAPFNREKLVSWYYGR